MKRTLNQNRAGKRNNIRGRLCGCIGNLKIILVNKDIFSPLEIQLCKSAIPILELLQTVEPRNYISKRYSKKGETK